MKNMFKKTFCAASVFAIAGVLGGCTVECPKKRGVMHQPRHPEYVQPVEVMESDTIIVYQTYEDADVNHLYAKMYTHSSNGGESKMGHIKFKETENGLKMMVDLKDMRPGVQYSVKVYQCSTCYNDARCCNNSKKINVQLPMLQTGMSGRLDQTYMIRGVSAAQLNGANIYLERDGGYKAGWGKLEK
jgi:hypothetical protein